MITCSTIAMGDQLGAQLGTLAALMHIGILNEQQVVFWEELKEFRRGFQFLNGFDIDGLKLLKRCGTTEQNVIQKYCGSFQMSSWKSQMKRIYGGRILKKTDGFIYRLVRRHYRDFCTVPDCQNGINTDQRLLKLCGDKNYDIRSGFGTYRDWGKNAEAILGRIHFRQSVIREGDAVLAALPKGKKRISVHLRRTDYLVMSSLNLDEAYYRKAMAYFDPQDMLFVVFSDDIEECKKMDLFSGMDVFFMDRHAAPVDMYLMSRMDGNIIANSSFSVWGALLNQKSEKTVCPYHYIGESSPESLYINGNYYPDHWIAL